MKNYNIAALSQTSPDKRLNNESFDGFASSDSKFPDVWPFSVINETATSELTELIKLQPKSQSTTSPTKKITSLNNSLEITVQDKSDIDIIWQDLVDNLSLIHISEPTRPY